MADTEVTIKVTTETDVNSLNDLNGLLDDTQNKANETGEALKTAFEEATNEVDRLTEELANIEMGESDADFDEISEQLEEATLKAETLGEVLNSIDGGGLDDAKDSASELGDELDNAREKTDELTDSMGLIESSMLMGVANEIGSMGDQAEGTAQSMDEVAISVGQLATNTGIAEPQMRSLIANISNVTFPQDEAIAYVNVLNQMGVSADKLGDSATNMDKINDATGMGSQKVMLLTQGLVALGVSADDLPSAFNAIAYAEAKVGGGAETLQTVLKRQAGTLNEYGMGVDATVVALSALQRQTGLTGMKLGTEFGNRLKECNGDLGALEQSLGLTAGSLSNASQVTGEYNGKLQELADEEMKHKTLTERLGAVYEDLALYLEPVLSPLMSFVGILGSFGQTALAINSLITLGETFGFLTVTEEGLTIAQWTLNASMLANPALWLVIAIVALIGALIYLYYTNEDVRNAIDGLGQAFILFGQIAYESIMNAVTWIMGALQGLWDYIMTLGGLIPQTASITGNAVIDSVLKFLTFMVTLPIQLQIIFTNAIAKALGFGDNFVQNMLQSGLRGANNFINQIATLPARFNQELNEIINNALNFAGRIGQILWNAGVNAITSFLNALDRHSPGKMQREFVAEITEMGERVPDESQTLISNMGKLGDNITGIFNPDFNTDFDNTVTIDAISKGMAGQVNYFYFNDTVVDNEERMERIVEYVTKTIRWNNKTAGRTI